MKGEDCYSGEADPVKYGFRSLRASFLLPEWIRPNEAVALNLFQFDAWATHWMLSYKKVSLVVKAFIIAFDQTVAP